MGTLFLYLRQSQWALLFFFLSKTTILNKDHVIDFDTNEAKLAQQIVVLTAKQSVVQKQKEAEAED